MEQEFIPARQGRQTLSTLTAADQQWLLGLSAMLRSQSDFWLAEFFGDSSLPERAGDVIIWHQGKFSRVRDLVEQCAAHSWNYSIYEAWVWQTAHHVHHLIRRVDVSARRAVMHHAHHHGYYEIDTRAMEDAIAEARGLLEGEPEFDESDVSSALDSADYDFARSVNSTYIDARMVAALDLLSP